MASRFPRPRPAQSQADSDTTPPATEDRFETARRLSQYYTRLDIAEACIATAARYFDLSRCLLVEPSAGNGSFHRLMSADDLAIDIEPQCPGVHQGDFLESMVLSFRPIGFIGNPPFGRCSNMAVAFFNQAAKSATFIAMIFPRTFRKEWILGKLDISFHLIHDEDVAADAFLFRGTPVSVPSVFQIWEYRQVDRVVPEFYTNHPDFEFTTRDKADFVIQRVGANAGRIHFDFKLKESSHFFIRGNVLHTMMKLDMASVAANTAGNPSISKSEIVRLYSELTGRPGTRRRSETRRATAPARGGHGAPGSRL